MASRPIKVIGWSSSRPPFLFGGVPTPRLKARDRVPRRGTRPTNRPLPAPVLLEFVRNHTLTSLPEGGVLFRNREESGRKGTPMKKLLMVMALAGLLAGCASFFDGDRGAGSGAGRERGTTGVSTGADAGMENGITGSESTPPP